jgi:hypothetical protein
VRELMPALVHAELNAAKNARGRGEYSLDRKGGSQEFSHGPEFDSIAGVPSYIQCSGGAPKRPSCSFRKGKTWASLVGWARVTDRHRYAPLIQVQEL